MKCSCDGDGGGGANLPLIDDTPFMVNQQQQQQQQQLPRNELLYQTLADHGYCFVSVDASRVDLSVFYPTTRTI